MLIHGISRDYISPGNTKNTEIFDLKKIVKEKNEEKKKIILLNNLKKKEKDNLIKLILSEENITKIHNRNIKENNNNQFNYKLRQLDTENYGSPDFRKKIKIINFNQILTPIKKKL